VRLLSLNVRLCGNNWKLNSSESEVWQWFLQISFLRWLVTFIGEEIVNAHEVKEFLKRLTLISLSTWAYVISESFHHFNLYSMLSSCCRAVSLCATDGSQISPLFLDLFKFHAYYFMHKSVIWISLQTTACTVTHLNTLMLYLHDFNIFKASALWLQLVWCTTHTLKHTHTHAHTHCFICLFSFLFMSSLSPSVYPSDCLNSSQLVNREKLTGLRLSNSTTERISAIQMWGG